MLRSFGNLYPVYELSPGRLPNISSYNTYLFAIYKKEYKYGERSYKSFGGNDSLVLDNYSVNSDSGRPFVFALEQ